MSTLVIRRHPQRSPTVFTEAIKYQKTCTDIMIYSYKAQQVVTIAWPLQRNGERVLPKQLREWLRARGLHWPCFCGLTAPSGVYLSCQIVHSVGGDAMAFCHYEPSTCHFFMNLSHIYHTTDLTSDYAFLRPLGKGQISDSDALLTEFALSKLTKTSIAPYFRGYCGECIPGVEQLAGNSTKRTLWGRTVIRRRSHAPSGTSKFHGDPFPIPSNEDQAHPPAAGPSRLVIDDAATRQKDILAKLMDGDGVSEFEWAGVVEKCESCACYFLAAGIGKHIIECVGSTVD